MTEIPLLVHYGSDGGAECGEHDKYADLKVPDALLTKDPALVTCSTCRGWLPIVHNWNPPALTEIRSPPWTARDDRKCL